MFIWKEDLAWKTILFKYTENKRDEIFKFKTCIAQKNLYLSTRKEKMHTHGTWYFYYDKNQKTMLFVMLHMSFTIFKSLV